MAMQTIALREPPRIASLLTSLAGTRRKKIVATVTGVNLIIAALLAMVGFWNSGSLWYWRKVTQDAALAVANRVPSDRKPAVTRWALSVHREGITDAEMNTAAGLFLQAGDRAAAAHLHLGLARANAVGSDVQAAVQHARRADQLVPSAEALSALLILAEPYTDAEVQAAAQMQTRYPASELSQTYDCIDHVTSFAKRLPGSCQAYPMIREQAAAGTASYARIEHDLAALPAKTEQEIAAALNWRDREALEYQRLVDEMNRSGYASAIIQSVWQTLEAQLPAPGERLDTWGWRQLLCSISVFRWICLLSDARLQPIVDRQELRRKLAADTAATVHAWRAAVDQAAYWQSPAPREALIGERERLVILFQGDVRAAVHARRTEVGLDRGTAIDAALRRPLARPASGPRTARAAHG
jgi:hypothetical protein